MSWIVLVGLPPRAAGHEGEGCHRWSPPPAQGAEGVLGCVAGVRGPQAEKEPAERQVDDTGTVQCIPCGECLSRYLLMFRRFGTQFNFSITDNPISLPP